MKCCDGTSTWRTGTSCYWAVKCFLPVSGCGWKLCNLSVCTLWKKTFLKFFVIFQLRKVLEENVPSEIFAEELQGFTISQFTGACRKDSRIPCEIFPNFSWDNGVKLWAVVFLNTDDASDVRYMEIWNHIKSTGTRSSAGSSCWFTLIWSLYSGRGLYACKGNEMNCLDLIGVLFMFWNLLSVTVSVS